MTSNQAGKMKKPLEPRKGGAAGGPELTAPVPRDGLPFSSGCPGLRAVGVGVARAALHWQQG